MSTTSALDQPTTTSKTPRDEVMHDDQAPAEVCVGLSRLPDDTAAEEATAAIRSARRKLFTAITGRIAQQRLTAAQAATVLHLTGPRVTQLLRADIDQFTLDEFISFLPALQLSLHIVPAPGYDLGPNATTML